MSTSLRPDGQDKRNRQWNHHSHPRARCQVKNPTSNIMVIGLQDPSEISIFHKKSGHRATMANSLPRDLQRYGNHSIRSKFGTKSGKSSWARLRICISCLLTGIEVPAHFPIWICHSTISLIEAVGVNGVTCDPSAFLSRQVFVSAVNFVYPPIDFAGRFSLSTHVWPRSELLPAKKAYIDRTLNHHRSVFPARFSIKALHVLWYHFHHLLLSLLISP